MCPAIPDIFASMPPDSCMPQLLLDGVLPTVARRMGDTAEELAHGAEDSSPLNEGAEEAAALTGALRDRL